MADATYAQTNFQGGEISPAFQGRADDEDYKKALALCLNYVPNQEGSLTARSGFKRLGITRHHVPARTLPFRFSAMYPYVSEFTGQGTRTGNLRLWANGVPVLDNIALANLVSVSGAPPTFTIKDTRSSTNLVPPEWATGDSIILSTGNGTAPMIAASYLFNREFLLNIVSGPAGTVTLTDAETGVPLSAAITLSADDLVFAKIRDIPTKYQYPEGVRQVQITEQSVSQTSGSSAVRATPPDHRVTYLYPLKSPQSLSADRGVQDGLFAENFIDGPYLDSVGTDIPLALDAATGTITATIHGYDSRIIYMKGDLMADLTPGFPVYYVSLIDNNKGNTPPALPGGVDANWYEVLVNEEQWETTDTYDIGHMTTVGPNNLTSLGINAGFVDGSAKVFYSKTTANSNNNPFTSTTNWSTTPPTWSAIITYTKRAFVIYGGVRYLAFAAPTLGTTPPAEPTKWVVAPDIATAVDTFSNTATGWLASPVFYKDDAGGSQSPINLGNPGRLIRLKSGPQPWSSKITYAINDLVNFNDVIYKALVGVNLNNNPETDATNWEVQATTILWTWGRITYAGDHYCQATIQILGDDLPSNAPVWEFRMGVYSDSTGWPTCGAYHEGRLWLSGVMPNRLDAGVPNQGFNFAPTAPDGTVSDANAIASTLNCEENETVVGLAPITEGLIALTSEAEWLISASSLNDPLTPTSVQARRTTAWSAFPTEVTRLPTGLAAIQKGGRRVLEYRNFVDMTSYQSRLNTSDFTRKCQHLTGGGVGMTQYQSLSQPVLWCGPSKYLIADFTNSLAHGFCTVPINPPVIATSPASFVGGTTLFGIAYSRAPNVAYAAPFSFEHGLTLSTGVPLTIESIAIQRGPQETSEYLYSCVTANNGKSYMEMMMPMFESTPLNDVLTNSTTVSTYGTLSNAYMVDAGRTPCGCQIAANGLSATFYGMPTLAGQTVSFTIRGKYVSDVTIAADGSINVLFTSTFTRADIYLAMRASFNYNALPSAGNEGKGSGVFGTGHGYQAFAMSDLTTSTVYSSVNFLAQFGYKYRRRGKMLRPQIGSQNGPTFAKTVRNDQAGIYVDAAQEISAGGSFSTMVPVKLSLDGTRNITAPGLADFVTGIFRVFIKDNYSFDGQICWEQTRPVPGNVLGVGGFDVVMDK